VPPSAADLELAFYEKFFFAGDLSPYPVQEEAFSRIFAGESLLVTVPTGTGKTMMAKAGIFKALQSGQKAVYTTPLRALTEEKYRELCADFGEDKVGFATGDYKVNAGAPVQVVVAEILWNKIYQEGTRSSLAADVVVMDEGHYFNDPERGYVWEQSIIGMDPRTQLCVLSATIGSPQQFCQWVYTTRRVPMELVQSTERKVPLYHEYRESYVVEVVKDLFGKGEVPVILFGFGREQCFERARLLKSCPRFVTDEERATIAQRSAAVLLSRGVSDELKSLLLHGIGVHHAGILPRYKQLVERLTLERLLKVVVSTETISAGINLPAKRVVFPELRKYIKKTARLLTSAEYHQMSGRAGRPQFDTEGIAIVLAPEAVVQEIRKELKDAQRGRFSVDESKVRKSAYLRAKTDAQKNGDVTWDKDAQDRLISGQPAPLSSQTRITAEQILAIGLPDLAKEALPGQASESASDPPEPPLPAYLNLNIRTVIDHLLLAEKDRQAAHKLLYQITANLRAMEVLDEHGAQVKGEMIGKLRGIDGPFVYYCLMNHQLSYEEYRELVEYLVDHDVVHRLLSRKGDEKRRAWIKTRLHERRRDEPQVTWEDCEADYERAFPRELSPIEKIHSAFIAGLPHPELHGNKVHKTLFAQMETEDLAFMDFVDKHGLEHEEGSLFSYLARVMKVARMLAEVTTIVEFSTLDQAVRKKLSVIDERVLDDLG
jgi:superfamily II DNA/RNA helicase